MKMGRILTIVLFHVALFCSAGNVKGVITNSEGKPMPYATVSILDKKITTTTNLSGEFCFANIPNGQYRLGVSFIGYKRIVENIEVADVPLNISLQTEEQSIKLGELMVLPDGMSMEDFILQQLYKHSVPLKNKLSEFKADVNFCLEKDMDLTNMPQRRTIRTLAWIAGYAKLLDVIIQNKYLKVRMTDKLNYKKGKLKGTNPKVTEMAPKLTERQVAAFENHGELLSGNLYDNVYKKIKDASKKLLKVRKKGYKDHFKYAGSYDLEGRTVYVAKYQQAEIHIVDGCWQILRLVHKISDEELGYVKLYFEFQEYSRDVFLPVSGFIKFDIKGNEQINGSGMISYSYNYF